MRNLEGLCESGKVCVTSKHKRGITYLTPNINTQFLRLLVMPIVGPASAENLLNVTVTAVLAAIELRVMDVCKKKTDESYH